MTVSAPSAPSAPETWTCPCCGAQAEGLPILTIAMPPAIFALPLTERRARAGADPHGEIVTLDAHTPQARHWIRSELTVPIAGRAEFVSFTLWLETDAAEAALYADPPEDAERICEGKVSTDMPSWRDHGLTDLPCTARWDPENRPLVTLLPHDHPMARECREGIPPERVAALAHGFLGCPEDAAPTSPARGARGFLRKLFS